MQIILQCTPAPKIRKCIIEMRLNGVNLEEILSFRYHGVDVTTGGGQGTKVIHRTNEGRKMFGAQKGIWKIRAVSRQTSVEMFEGTVAPSVLYDSEC